MRLTITIPEGSTIEVTPDPIDLQAMAQSIVDGDIWPRPEAIAELRATEAKMAADLLRVRMALAIIQDPQPVRPQEAEDKLQEPVSIPEAPEAQDAPTEPDEDDLLAFLASLQDEQTAKARKTPGGPRVLDADDVRGIKKAHAMGARPKDLGPIYGCTPSNISKILTGKSWASVSA